MKDRVDYEADDNYSKLGEPQIQDRLLSVGKADGHDCRYGARVCVGASHSHVNILIDHNPVEMDNEMRAHVEMDNIEMLVTDECDSQLIFRSIFEVFVFVQHSTLVGVALAHDFDYL